MGPVLLLLLLAAQNAELAATAPKNSINLTFIVAFPENIAYYHPDLSENVVQITALYNGTTVTITSYNLTSTKLTLHRGESQNYTLDEIMETNNAEISNKVLRIESNKLITVHAINFKSNSVQTALVLPNDQLVKEYLIPGVPEIEGTTSPADKVTTGVTERAPFKLIIINGGNELNTVTVKGSNDKTVALESNHIAQIWLNKSDQFRSVTASLPVAVLFGHSCALRHNCTCGQLYATLPPTKEEKMKFYIPFGLANTNEAFVLVSDETKAQMKPFKPDSPLVETAGTAILYRPGLLLTLIPETDFAACYVVHTIHDTTSSVYIVVHKKFTDGVHDGNLPLETLLWKTLKGTDYVSATYDLTLGKSFIWHASSKMAVYFIGRKESAWFGNPAAIISRNPDFRGCVLSPEVLQIGDEAAGWRESLKYCRDQNMELVSLPEAQFQTQIFRKLPQNDGLKKLWIGMRRSSQSGEWYWLNGAPVNDTNWAEGEPGAVHDGQCAMMSLEKNKDFGWRDEDCCEAARPLCYNKSILLEMD